MTDMWLLSTSVKNPCQKLDYGFLTAVRLAWVSDGAAWLLA